MSILDVKQKNDKMSKANAKEKDNKILKLNVKQKNWLISFHIGFAALWTGTVLSMCLIAFSNRLTSNADAIHPINATINLLDDYIVIPSSIFSLISGGLLSWLTTWGFTKHYWVIVKWIATIALMVFGTFWLYPWANSATAISEAERLQAFENPLYMFEVKGVILGTLIQALCLLVIIAISVLKPWGKRPTKGGGDKVKPAASS